MKRTIYLKSIFLLFVLLAGIVSANAQIQETMYVKWKLVAYDQISNLENDEVVVIVDLTTGTAMTNDNGTKDPGSVEVELNYDKDRILGEVPENVQWKFVNLRDGFNFYTTTSSDDNTETNNYLYADKKGLKVGDVPENTDDESPLFHDLVVDGVHYLLVQTADKEFFAGMENSMFSNTWKTKELKEDDGNITVDDKIKDTRFAIFKKVEDGQKIPNLKFPKDNYELNFSLSLLSKFHSTQYEKATCDINETISYYSSNTNVAVITDGVSLDNPDPTGDYMVLKKRGTIQVIARIPERNGHDKAVAVCTLRINDAQDDLGSRTNPLTVAQAIDLAKGNLAGYTLEEDRCYFIKGKVNKVNSGMLAMFGDMGLDEIMGDDMDMEERMGDMDDFDMNEMGDMMGGMDFGSMIPGMGNTEGLTYYISDDGTKDNRLKVVNGHGKVTLTSTEPNIDGFKRAEFAKLEDLSPGDDLVVYGPLVVSEEKNMFSDLLGGSGGIGSIGGNNQQSDYEWVQTELDELEDDDVVLLVDKSKKIALNSDINGTSVTIKNSKIADNNKVSDNIKWTLTKNDNGSVTFTKDGNPLSVLSDLSLTVGQGQYSEFVYNSGLLGIELPPPYCITWEETDGDYSAKFESNETTQNSKANFIFYKRVLKTEEDKRTVKVGELNYLHEDPEMTLVVQDQHLYEGYTKNLEDNQDFFYTLKKTPNGRTEPAQVKSADEETAKWVKIDEDDENSDSLFTAMAVGKTKVTVRVKVVVRDKDPDDEDSKEKYYTMKRKFNLEVRPRDKQPEGHNVGEYVLVKNVNELEDGTRMLFMGARTKDEDVTNYAMASDNSMMGGGKGGKKVDNDKIQTKDDGREYILFDDVPDGTQEIILEEVVDDAGSPIFYEGNKVWHLNVGHDKNYDKLYLYASLKAKKEGEDDDEEGGFNMDEMMEMFMPSSGLKVATLAEATSKDTEGVVVDSCQAIITITDDIATIKFINIPADEKNTIVLTSSFDMDSMMNMFSSKENEDETQDPSTEGQNTEGQNTEGNTGMGNFDFFMASFNTKKPDEVDGKKAMLPRIFGFVLYDQYPITIGAAEWMTIVSEYNVAPENDVEAYVVTKVAPGNEQYFAQLEPVTQLKGGEPYLLHAPSKEYIMTRIPEEFEVEEPDVNFLLVSDKNTDGNTDITNVYVLANKSLGVGFYKWAGGALGTGRVYLYVEPEEESPSGAGEYIHFGDAPTDISTVINQDATEDAPYFNLSGQRMNNHPSQKGIYITDGRKVVIK